MKEHPGRMSRALNALGSLVGDLLRPTNLLAVVLLFIVLYAGTTYLMARLREARLAGERQALEEAVGTLERRNAALRQTVSRLEAQCQELEGFVRRLTAESRVAEVRVVGRRLDAQNEPVWTLEFVEHGREGKPLPAKVITLRGKEVYFDALVIKFAHDLVKVGEPLRGKSLHVFRRAFGSAQQPREGPMLAATGSIVPDAYRPEGGVSAFETALWLRFWHWASHPDEAAAEGIRVAQVEAVAIPPEPGATYRITLEHAGGLNITKVVPPQSP